MIDKNLKDEIRIYYETHEDSNKEVAKKFNITYRTLMTWIQKEKWQKAKGLKDILQSNVRKDLVKKEFGTIIDNTARKLKQQLKDNLNDSLSEVDEILKNNLLDGVTDEILLKAMNLNFLQKNMTLGALLAKDELIRMTRLRKADKASPALIASAEKFVSILSNLQKSFYGNNDASLNLQVVNINEDLSKLSNKELMERIQSLESEKE